MNTSIKQVLHCGKKSYPRRLAHVARHIMRLKPGTPTLTLRPQHLASIAVKRIGLYYIAITLKLHEKRYSTPMTLVLIPY